MTLKKDIVSLLVKNTLDENAKKFDDFMLTIELSLLDEEINAGRAVDNAFISCSELNSEQEEILMKIISYLCENGDITKDILVNESPFDERLSVFDGYMLPLVKYIDNIHDVVNPDYGVV